MGWGGVGWVEWVGLSRIHEVGCYSPTFAFLILHAQLTALTNQNYYYILALAFQFFAPNPIMSKYNFYLICDILSFCVFFFFNLCFWLANCITLQDSFSDSVFFFFIGMVNSFAYGSQGEHHACQPFRMPTCMTLWKHPYKSIENPQGRKQVRRVWAAWDIV